MKRYCKGIGCMVAVSLFLAFLPIGLTSSEAQPAKSPAASGPKMKLRFSGIHPAMSVPSRAWQFWMDKIKEKTDGRIVFEPYWGATLLSPGELIDGTAKGLSDVTCGLWIFDPGKVPLGAYDLNFLFNDPNVKTQVKIKRQMFAEIPALNAELAKWNLGPAIYFAPNSPYDLLTRKPVKSLADLKGMRIGHTPIEFVSAFKAAGAAPVVSPAPEFYQRLERGLIDGVCLNQNIMGIYKLHEIAKHYTTINLNTSVIFTLYINGGLWKKLSPEDQQVFKDAAREAEAFYVDAYEKDLANIRKTHKDAGVQTYTMPAGDITQWMGAIPDVPAEWAKKMEAQGAPGWQIVDKYLELSKKEGWSYPRKWGAR